MKTYVICFTGPYGDLIQIFNAESKEEVYAFANDHKYTWGGDYAVEEINTSTVGLVYGRLLIRSDLFRPKETKMLTPICSLFGMPMHHHEFSVLRFCEELHMVANGSGDYGNETIMMREYLRAKILNWQPSTHAFDSIVKDLILQTLQECDESGIFDSLEVAKRAFDVDPSYWKEQLDKLRR